jgi:hypothetical protein
MTFRLALAATAALTTPAMAELSLSSETPGLDLVPLSTLPNAPAPKDEAGYCTHLFIDSVSSPGAQDATAKGWHVTAEAPFGDLTAVSFVGDAIPATSGTCELVDGNVGLYSGSQLVALLYSTQPEEVMIGRIRPFGNGLRILSGDLLPRTTADLVRAGDTVSVTLPAAEEPVCNGTTTVPAIEDLPINEARALLLSFGWQPVPGDPAQQGLGWAKDIAAAGVPEVGDCSGTGLAFCAFRYSGAAGDLTVITAGEIGEDGSLPTVARYRVDCR